MIEMQIISKILLSGSNEWLIGEVFYDDPKCFGDYALHYQIILDHKEKWGNIPDPETFCDLLNQQSKETSEDWVTLDVKESNDYLISAMRKEVEWRIGVDKWLHDVKTGSMDDAYALLDRAGELAWEYRDKLKSVVDRKEFGYSIADTADQLLSLSEDHYKIIPTGFEELDYLMGGGIRKSKELIAVLAPSGTGKSWITLKMALAAYDAGYRVGIISPEMDQIEVLERIIVLQQHINYNDVLSGKYDKEKAVQTLSERERVGDASIRIIPDVEWDDRSTDYIRILIRRNRLDALYVDGGQYIDPTKADDIEEAWRRLLVMSRELYKIAAEYDVPIIMSVQCNRDGSKESKRLRKPPLPENIGESSKMVEQCTKVLSVGHYDNELKLCLTKSRKTPTGTVVVYDWNTADGTFRHLRNEPYYDQEGDNVSANQSVGEILTSRTPRRTRDTQNTQPLRRNNRDDNMPFA